MCNQGWSVQIFCLPSMEQRSTPGSDRRHPVWKSRTLKTCIAGEKESACTTIFKTDPNILCISPICTFNYFPSINSCTIVVLWESLTPAPCPVLYSSGIPSSISAERSLSIIPNMMGGVEVKNRLKKIISQ